MHEKKIFFDFWIFLVAHSFKLGRTREPLIFTAPRGSERSHREGPQLCHQAVRHAAARATFPESPSASAKKAKEKNK